VVKEDETDSLRASKLLDQCELAASHEDLGDCRDAQKVTNGSAQVGSDYVGRQLESASLFSDNTKKSVAATVAAKVALSREDVRRAVDFAAKGVLLCAHPSGEYQSTAVNKIDFGQDGITVDFTIDYRCRGIERDCSIRLSATFGDDGTFARIDVLHDTAFTDATIGLRACGKLAGMLKEQVRAWRE